MSSVVTAAVTGQAVGESLWFGGGLVTFKVTSEQSKGELLLLEHAAARGKTTPYHIHPDHDEAGYVLEGEILFNLDGVEQRAGPGSTVWIPRGTPHAMLIVSDVARSIWAVTPGHMTEAFFREAGDVALSQTLPPSTDIDIARLRAAGERTGAIVVLGPPPFARQ